MRRKICIAGKKIPGTGPRPQSGYDVRGPGNGGAGNLRPRSTEY